ncbi:DUF2975 domain-containing protein [Tenacibaculum sp. SDUM215027]|uniref:DUF2975 domain-containing protein n=1 Tax=Tenacibaculum sp. SDUM215027 TaxID=3422596 RepID=UPI003D315A76
MKSILSILKVFCTLLVVSISVKFFEKLFRIFHYAIYRGSKTKVFKLSIPESWNDGYYYSLLLITLILIGYLLYLVVVFRKVIFNFSKNDVFTKENSNRLRKVGKGLIIYGVIVLCLATILGLVIDGGRPLSMNSDPVYSAGYVFGYTIGTSISKVLPIFVVALFVQFISFIVVKGNALQEENNLTI